MKSLIIPAVLILSFLSSCNKKADYSEFNKSYGQFLEMATKELSSKHGLSLAVIKDDLIIFENYQGYSNIDKDEKVDKNTCFYIASSTKSFTALAALLLESKGKLSFDKTLADFFPEVNFDSSIKADRITIPHLLQHTSGVKNWPMVSATAYTGNHNPRTLLSQLEKFTKVNTKAPFGTFSYTNIGYNIVGMIIEKELGKDWKTVVKEEIYNPLKMEHTSALMSEAEKNGWKVAKPHSQLNDHNKLERLSLEKKDNTMHAAGGMISTTGDISKWIRMMLNNGKLDGKQVYPSNLVKKSTFPHASQKRTYRDLQRFGYGYGWNLATTPLGDTLIHHFGGFSGSHAEVSFMPSTGVGVVVMSNENGIGSDLSFLLASYAFDYFSGRENINEYYLEKLNDCIKDLNEWKKKVKDHENDRAKRKWQLDLPLSAYAGTFKSDLFGTLKIEYQNNTLIAHLGNLKSTPATPYKNVNSIRVEMTPRSGSIIQFELNNNKVKKAIWEGLTFIK